MNFKNQLQVSLSIAMLTFFTLSHYGCDCNDSSSTVIEESGKLKKRQQVADKDSLFKSVEEDSINSRDAYFDVGEVLLNVQALIKQLKRINYPLELRSDTFYYGTDDPTKFTFGHGLFWKMYQTRTDILIRHIITDPGSRKLYRVYLIQATYPDSNDLQSKIISMKRDLKDSFPLGWDLDIFQKERLSPLHDFVITIGTNLYWINAGNEYSTKEFIKMVEVLKENLDLARAGTEIMCLMGSDCVYF